MSSQHGANPYVPARRRRSDYPVIDTDPHMFRVMRFMRPSDYAAGTAVAAVSPLALYAMELVSPSFVGKGAMAPVMRLAVGIGLGAGFLTMYSRSHVRFLGLTENEREVNLDMREMVDKVKNGVPLYGKSELPEHQQNMAARNSRYANFGLFVLPFFNLVNHNQHGVDTAKYYRQAELELEAERVSREGS